MHAFLLKYSAALLCIQNNFLYTTKTKTKQILKIFFSYLERLNHLGLPDVSPLTNSM